MPVVCFSNWILRSRRAEEDHEAFVNNFQWLNGRRASHGTHITNVSVDSVFIEIKCEKWLGTRYTRIVQKEMNDPYWYWWQRGTRHYILNATKAHENHWAYERPRQRPSKPKPIGNIIFLWSYQFPIGFEVVFPDPSTSNVSHKQAGKHL